MELHFKASYCRLGHKTSEEEIDTDWGSRIRAVKRALTTNSSIPPFIIKALSKSADGKVFGV